MRPIDADELKRYIDIFNIACGCNDDHQEEILEAIDMQSTIDLSEEQSGRWIQKTDEYGDYYECSVCGEELPRIPTTPFTISNPYPEMISIEKTDFCPYCGKKNGGELVSDSIDRMGTLKAIEDYFNPNHDTDELPASLTKFLIAVGVIISSQPPAQPERTKGRWIIIAEFEDCYYAKCNQCNITQVFYFNKPLTNFCPNCGSDMRGEEDE